MKSNTSSVLYPLTILCSEKKPNAFLFNQIKKKSTTNSLTVICPILARLQLEHCSPEESSYILVSLSVSSNFIFVNTYVKWK